MNRIFAAAIGAFMAVVLALQFGGSTFATILSLVAGGAVAWIGYDLRGFAHDIIRAFSETFTRLANWRPDWRALRYHSATAVWMSLCILSLIDALVFLALIGGNDAGGTMPFGKILWTLIQVIVIGFIPLWTVLTFGMSQSKDNLEELKGIHLYCRSFVSRYFNPLAWAFWVCYGLVKFAIVCVLGSVGVFIALLQAARQMPGFIILAFAYTHNEGRKICFIDAVVGGAVGIYFREPLVGAVVGAVVGALHAPLTTPLARRILQEQK